MFYHKNELHYIINKLLNCILYAIHIDLNQLFHFSEWLEEMLQWPGWITSKCLLACWFISFVCYYEIIDCRSGKGYADDYYLDSKSQCAGKRGACPDRYVWIGFILQWWWVLKHLQSGNLKNCTQWTMFCEVV